MEFKAPPLGALIAVIVLVVDIILILLGQPPGGQNVAYAIGLLALARLT